MNTAQQANKKNLTANSTAWHFKWADESHLDSESAYLTEENITLCAHHCGNCALITVEVLPAEVKSEKS